VGFREVLNQKQREEGVATVMKHYVVGLHVPWCCQWEWGEQDLLSLPSVKEK